MDNLIYLNGIANAPFFLKKLTLVMKNDKYFSFLIFINGQLKNCVFINFPAYF